MVELRARVGGETDVLIERPGMGRAAFYAAVRFSGSGAAAGSLRRMRIIDSDRHNLVGVPVQ